MSNWIFQRRIFRAVAELGRANIRGYGHSCGLPRSIPEFDRFSRNEVRGYRAAIKPTLPVKLVCRFSAASTILFLHLRKTIQKNRRKYRRLSNSFQKFVVSRRCETKVSPAGGGQRYQELRLRPETFGPSARRNFCDDVRRSSPGQLGNIHVGGITTRELREH